MRFTKMHGAGNDYIYVNEMADRVPDPKALAIRMCRPHYGVGADGLILVGPSDTADFRMRMFNSDGSEGAMCGNGARCVALFCYARKLTRQKAFTLETGAGVRAVRLNRVRGGLANVTVDMGIPANVRAEPALTRVSMGNPHAVVFLQEDPFRFSGFDTDGPALCRALDANIEFAQVLAPDHLKMRVWERGSGETLACGTGACAALVAAHAAGFCGREATVTLRGGDLHVLWQEADGHVRLTGEAEILYHGIWRVP